MTRQVPAESQVIVDVNQLNAHPTGTCDGPCRPTPSVSAEVTATGGLLVVERQMFFRYHMAAPAHQSVTAIGWTDVTGQLAPAVTIAQFAEGDINPNFEEWLVLQNPTNQSEAVTVTLFNALQNSAQQGMTLPAHSRTSISINALARSTYLVGENESSRAYELSLLLQGQQGALFVVERPQYFNLGQSGVQGGTDVIGYSLPLKLNDPWDITNGPDGNLWFTDYSDPAIGKINPTTHAITEYRLSAGAYPELITSGPDGNLWFTNDTTPTGSIDTINPTTQVITEYSSGMTPGASPEDITMGSDGNLWFSDDGTNQIGTINPMTHHIMESSQSMVDGSSPWGITTGPDGNLWFADYGAGRIGMVPVTLAPFLKSSLHFSPRQR